MESDERFVLRKPAFPQLAGVSRGHWEGETLVVETTQFRGGQSGGTGPNMHLTERFTRLDPDTVVYDYTVTDPTVYTAPYTVMMPFRRTDVARSTSMRVTRATTGSTASSPGRGISNGRGASCVLDVGLAPSRRWQPSPIARLGSVANHLVSRLRRRSCPNPPLPIRVVTS